MLEGKVEALRDGRRLTGTAQIVGGGHGGIEDRDRIARHRDDEKRPRQQDKIEQRERTILVVGTIDLVPYALRDPIEDLRPEQVGDDDHQPLQDREEEDLLLDEDQLDRITELTPEG